MYDVSMQFSSDAYSAYSLKWKSLISFQCTIVICKIIP